jgi:hypothetical protein
VVKVRQHRPSFSQIFPNRVPPSGNAEQKNSTEPVGFRQPVWMFDLPFDFVCDAQELKNQLFPQAVAISVLRLPW